jgi:hypothetical protein
VSTIATDYLVPPLNQTIVEPHWFDLYAGATAVHYSIQQQVKLRPTLDPYEAHLETCDQGDIHPVLPRISLDHHQKSLQFDFMLLSLPPTPKDPLAKAWPTLQKHLPELDISGPYCFQGHLGAYAINASYHSSSSSTWAAAGGGDDNNNNSSGTGTWKLTPGCVTGLPCWPSEHPPKPHGGGDDGPPSNNKNMVWTIWHEYGVYIILVLLVISLTVNCQFSYHLQHRRQDTNTPTTPQRRRIITTRRVVTSTPASIMEDHVNTDTGADTISSLEEPLLSSNNNDPESSISADAAAGVVPVDQC